MDGAAPDNPWASGMQTRSTNCRSIGGGKTEAIASLRHQHVIQLLCRASRRSLITFQSYLDVVEAFDGMLRWNMPVNKPGLSSYQ